MTLGVSPGPEASSAQARGLLLVRSQLEAGFLGDPVLLQGVLQPEHREGTSERRPAGLSLNQAAVWGWAGP